VSARLASGVVLACSLALPFAACAQSGKVYRIGLLETTSASANRTNLDALLRGLREAGYVEGKNLIIDYRSADGRIDRFPELAADLVRAKPDVIIARGTSATLAAKKASSIPIVMTSSADPVAARAIANLAKPGGNVTGLSSIVSELGAKRIEILKQLVPNAKRVAVILNMANPVAAEQWKELQRASGSLGVEFLLLDVRDVQALPGALESAVKHGAHALNSGGAAVEDANRRTVIDFVAKRKLPAIYSARNFVEAGGLISYGVHYPDLYYRAASYVDKILKGAKPGDLPVERPTKLELVINLRTAKALGVAVPRELLLRADEVIQ
jgi:putative ABC transport system substrate-binding protein